MSPQVAADIIRLVDEFSPELVDVADRDRRRALAVAARHPSAAALWTDDGTA